MVERTHIRIAQRDKDRLDSLKDTDESYIMAIRAAISALEKEREQ